MKTTLAQAEASLRRMRSFASYPRTLDEEKLYSDALAAANAEVTRFRAAKRRQAQK